MPIDALDLTVAKIIGRLFAFRRVARHEFFLNLSPFTSLMQ